jgi:thiol:disulfide interchange protein DsbD
MKSPQQPSSARIVGILAALAMLLGALATPTGAAESGPAARFDPFSRPLALGAKPAPRDNVRAELLADTAAIEPGKPFRLGVKFTIDPEWHIYWKNAGDAGEPTAIKWDLPAGFEAVGLQWPAPQRMADAWLVSYGYHDEVLLFAEVTPPAQLSGDAVTLKAEGGWLVCREICIPGKSAMSLTLPVGTAQASASADLFAATDRLVPRPYPAIDKAFAGALRWISPDQPATIAPETGETTIELGLAVEDPWRIDTDAAGDDAPGLFPLLDKQWQKSNPEATETGERKLLYRWTLKPHKQSVATAAGGVQAVLRAPLIDTRTNERRTVVFEHPVRVGDAGVAAAPTSQPPADETGASGEDRMASTAVAEQSGEKSASLVGSPAGGLSFLAAKPLNAGGPISLWYALVFAFLGGLILNVMPCVLPVISLKVMSFVRHAGEDRRRILNLGLVYGAGVLASFALLAAAVVAIKLAGAQLGWGFQMQEPRFVIAIAAVVLIFALSLFGVFEVALPGAASSLVSAGVGRQGYTGSFFNGVLATVLATPCSAPFLGPAVGFAFAQPVWMIPIFFLTIGAGLAFPYVLLAANPGWLRVLPKPGAWMETVKQLMGFALIATLVWLMWILAGQLGAQGVVWVLAFLTTVAMACWLLGKGASPRFTASGRSMLATAAAILLVAGYLAFPAPYLRQWSRMEPTAGLSQVALANLEKTPTLTEAGDLNWIPFSLPTVERLVESGRTVFIDFTADWCVTCKINEHGALATERVSAALSRHNAALVKADWTNYDATIGNVLAQLGKSAVPVYAILPAGRPAEPIVFEALITPSMVEDGLERAAKTDALAYNL